MDFLWYSENVHEELNLVFEMRFSIIKLCDLITVLIEMKNSHSPLYPWKSYFPVWFYREASHFLDEFVCPRSTFFEGSNPGRYNNSVCYIPVVLSIETIKKAPTLRLHTSLTQLSLECNNKLINSYYLRLLTELH